MNATKGRCVGSNLLPFHAEAYRRTKSMKNTKLCILAIASFWTFSTLGCDRGNETKTPRRKSARLNWVLDPAQGSQVDNQISVPGANISFEVPDTLYVLKQCEEASHVGAGPDGDWMPVVRCRRDGSGDGEEAPVALTFYLTAKDMLINERSVATIENQLTTQGFKVEEAAYYDEYLSKPGRRGILVEYHTVDSDGFPVEYVRRFMFPKDDVLFVVQTEFPYANDRSGVDRDWQRILWNFQLDEDGPLYSD